ncbi:MAG: hydroxymethylbilane synthase [Actinomycetota bacterium]
MPIPNKDISTWRSCGSSSSLIPSPAILSPAIPTSPITDLVIASRGSRLALRQAEIVAAAIERVHPDLATSISVIKTQGDVDQRPFTEIGGKGLFTSEVERAVALGEAHIAVHSAKDLTGELHPDCSIICVPERAPRADVIVGGTGASGEERLGGLQPGAVVGTSSLRRRALLAEARPDLEVREFRGNLDTRLAKVENGEVDAAVLAAAGIDRLGVWSAEEISSASLGADWWVPAPGQGVLAIEGLTENRAVIALLAHFEDPHTRAELECERAFAARMEGGCSIPLGCSAQVSGHSLLATGFLGLPDGSRSMRDRISGPLSAAAAMGRELAQAIIEGGGDEILEELGDIGPGGAPWA